MQQTFLLSILVLLVHASSSVVWKTQTPVRQKPSAQTVSMLKVSSAGGKKILVVSGAQKSIVDLGKDIMGCLDTYDPTMPKQPLKRRLGLKVIDKISKENKHYLVLLASAQSNCNVQGNCGAAEDYTLIWLKLDHNLNLEEKKAAVIEDCRADVAVTDPTDNDKDELVMKLVGGKLNLEYGNISDRDDGTTSRLVYDRKSPELGFVITTTKNKAK